MLAGHVRTSATCGAVLENGRAVAPAYAPSPVKAAVAAANRIDGRPYVWGGGHASWRSHGYDCSGAVGYALHGAGMLDVTMVSGQLAGWGEPGVGRWITVYANVDHVYMVIAGLRFDTRGDLPGVAGSAQLVQGLLELDLIDELRLMVFPVVLGSGKRLFGEPSAKKPLRLIDSKTVGAGVAILVYEPLR